MPTENQPAWETDVLVVGSGAGALTAALTAAELGLEPLVVEKAHLWGGTSATSGGTLWIPCSRHMREAGVEDSPEEAYAYLKALVGDEAPDSKIRAYISNATKMVDFLEAHGGPQFHCVNYADYHMDLPGAKQNRSHEPLPTTANALGREDYDSLQPMHRAAQAFGRVNWTIGEARPIITKAPGWWKAALKVMLRYWLDAPQRYNTSRDRRLTCGNALLSGLRKALNDRGVPVRLGVALQSLILEQGRVVGAVVDASGMQRRIRARRGVILAAGGFERNAAMRHANIGPSSPDWSGSQSNNTGDAIQAAQDAGAALDLMDAAWWAPAIRLADEDRARPMFVERALPGCMIVNQHGRRYMNESASYHVAGGEMMRLNSPQCPTAPSWFIFDGNYRANYSIGPLMAGPPSQDKNLKSSFWEVLRKADGVAGLAAQMQVDADALQATFARFNKHAAKGEDPDFDRGLNGYDRYYGDPRNKPNPCLAPLHKAPYYAIKIFPGDIGTKGGVVADEHGRALNRQGAPIPGLYAIGNTSASVMGRTYPGAGTTLGPAMTFGYLAAHHVTQMDIAPQAV